VKEGIESLTGVLTQQTPNRDNYPQRLKDWTNAVTPDGTTLQQWISTELWPKVERYGVCYSYARRPTVGGSNLAEQEKAIRDKGLPEVLLHVIIPENLPWWHEDELGQFEIVHYTEEITKQRIESGYPVENETYTRHWWVTLEGWWYVDDNPVQKGEQALKVEDSGFWNTDRKPMQTFPIVPWEVKDRVPPTQAASYAQLAYFRKESELHVVEVNAAFPQTWVPTTAGDEDPEETVKGPHAVAGWDPEGTGGAKPMMLETTGVSLTHFAEKRLPDLESEALAPYGRQREVGGNDSGVALAHIQETAKNLYRQHSKAGGKSEFAAMQPVAELLGVLDQFDESARAAWPRKFGVLADANQSEILTAFWELEPGDGFKKEILSQFAELTISETGAGAARAGSRGCAVWARWRTEASADGENRGRGKGRWYAVRWQSKRRRRAEKGAIDGMHLRQGIQKNQVPIWALGVSQDMPL
jgi:hypothetical protein